MGRSIIQEMSYAFAIRVVNACKYLSGKGEHVLPKQMLKSGTAIGAWVRKGVDVPSRAGFLNKMNVALKEAS